MISTLPEESQNVYLTLTARYLNPQITIIARADYLDGEKKLMIAGANHVVVPHILGGTRMAMASLQPNVLDFMRMTVGTSSEGLIIEEMIVPDGSPMTGKSIADSSIKQRYGVTVIAVKKPSQEMAVNPEPSTVIAPGDILILIGDARHMEQLTREMERR